MENFMLEKDSFFILLIGEWFSIAKNYVQEHRVRYKIFFQQSASALSCRVGPDWCWSLNISVCKYPYEKTLFASTVIGWTIKMGS